VVKYVKNISLLPLLDDKIVEAFREDVMNENYSDKNSLYKCKYQAEGIKYFPVKDALNVIYKNKCAYCETQINRTSTNIEHYRPKSIYYALAYSWSNLLPICNMCNSKKSNRFEIVHQRVCYNYETLEALQYITQRYNELENPKFIHPEIDTYEHFFRFNTNGKIIVYKNILNSDRMIYTIKHSDLNHHNLQKRRAKILRDFVNMIKKLYNLFDVFKRYKDKKDLNTFKKDTKEEIKIFFNDTNEFIAVRKYIIKRLRFFLAKCDAMFVKFFKGYLEKYIRTVDVYY
jgi:uncharacterized protein (TIGR02646 family)